MRPERHLHHPPDRDEAGSQREQSRGASDTQLPVGPARRADGFEHHFCSGFDSLCRSKNFHLSMAAGIATSKNPTIISSEVWSPQVTVFSGSGLCGLFFELSYQAIARRRVPAFNGRDSASL